MRMTPSSVAVNRPGTPSGQSIISHVLPANPRKESGPEGTRTPDLRHARVERRFRRRSLSFEKPLKQDESTNRPTTDVRYCSRRLSSNCRQLHKQIQGIKGNLIHRPASLF